MPGKTPQDQLAKFSWGGQYFPVLDCEVEGGERDHVHEYSHTDGGDPEKLGRSLYKIRLTINALAKLPGYPSLWPKGINAMMAQWESGVTLGLVVPDIGTIQAYAVNWTRKWSWKVRSGITCTVTFREDSTNLPLPITVGGASNTNLASSSANLALIAYDSELSPSSKSLITSLTQLVGSFQAVSDSANLFGNQVIQQLAQIMSLCQQADNLTEVQNANNVQLMRAVHDLWAQAQAYANDSQQKNLTLQQWIAPAQMDMIGASVAIFGDATHIEDLLALNTGTPGLPLVYAGTTLVYYPPTQNASSSGGGLALGALGVPHQ